MDYWVNFFEMVPDTKPLAGVYLLSTTEYESIFFIQFCDSVLGSVVNYYTPRLPVCR